MPPSKLTYSQPDDVPSSVLREDGIEYGFIGTLQGLKYDYRPDTASEFPGLLDEIVTPDVFTAAKTLLCFLQLFIVSNRDSTYDFANNNARHFEFNQATAMRDSAIQRCEAFLRSLSGAKDNRLQPVYQFAA